MTISTDDLRAAVQAGTITEAQAVSIITLSEARQGFRENIEGLDEPFELFKGFNEIFIVLGLSILFAGFVGVTGLLSVVVGEASFLPSIIGIAGVWVAARYFIGVRRMIGPASALAAMFACFSIALGLSVASLFDASNEAVAAIVGASTTGLLLLFWRVFHVPFVLALVALSAWMTSFAATSQNGFSLLRFQDLFDLTSSGPYPLVTLVLGLVALFFAMRFDMSDPHRVTRRSVDGFWLHVIAAPAIVNTVALTISTSGTMVGQIGVLVFVILIGAFAIIIDRRSFLISGVGYAVAIAVTALDGKAFYFMLLLGVFLVTLGAQWEALRNWMMKRLPDFPGKDRLPPWQQPVDHTN
ncbi:hypothetical protein [Actibacterium pelagium]|uniref:DUF2157 domain-containing protein n=1 Tax=Actibacterium pelagium TaxID=2029103 RepID=A0A917AIC2_9RHOB|nr:hypothetical protein [Actibacterium pelagium]GGE55288.1 hypothetical protein GCM10011517_23600 [Actibacterium pelagium]